MVEDLDTNTQSIDTPDNSTGFIITGLIPATNYTIYLSAFTEAGEGNISVAITNFTSFDGIYICIACNCVCIYVYHNIHKLNIPYLYLVKCRGDYLSSLNDRGHYSKAATIQGWCLL